MSIKQQSCVEAMKLALWHEAMAKEPNRNQAKREKHEATAKFIRQVIADFEKQDKFCDNNCVWTDHHKDCVRAEKQDRKCENCGEFGPCCQKQEQGEPVVEGSIHHLKVMMEESAWEGRLELSDALANIDQFYTHPYIGQPKQEPYGWVSQHTTKGMYEWQFNKELSGVYKDTAISILPVHTYPPVPKGHEPKREHDMQDVRCECCGYMTHHREHLSCIHAAQPKRELVWLTDDEVEELWERTGDYGSFYLAVESKLKEQL